MVISCVIDQIGGDQWGDHDGRNTNAELLEIETVMIIVSSEMVSPGLTVVGGVTWSKKPPCSS